MEWGPLLLRNRNPRVNLRFRFLLTTSFLCIISTQVTIVHNSQAEETLQACRTQLAEEAKVAVSISHSKHDTHRDIYKVKLATTPPIELPGVLRTLGGLTKNEVHHLALTAEAILRFLPKVSHKALLLLAPWINPSLAELLREKGIFYVDAVGNMYVSIDRPRVVLNIQGRRPEAPPKADPGRLIEPSGLKVIHLILNDPASLTLPYRTLAPRAGVSFASVGIVLRALAKSGHLALRRKRLENVPTLVDHFVRGYELKLRPEILLGTFRHRTRDLDSLAPRLKEVLGSAGGQWAFTGGHAAGLLTRHLKTDHLSILVDERSEAAVRAEPMLADPREGNVTLFRLFAPSAIASSDANYIAPTATPLLVYAELLHDGRPRELETAALIRPLILPAETVRGS